MAGYHLNRPFIETPWKKDGACIDTDPDLFFPIGTTGPAIEQIETAKAVCRECSVQTQCLEYAIETNEDHGIWGGTSEDERRLLRKSSLARELGGTATQ